MEEVVKTMKMMSREILSLLVEIEMELNIPVEIKMVSADQHWLVDTKTGRVLSVPILERQLCSGEPVFVFEFPVVKKEGI